MAEKPPIYCSSLNHSFFSSLEELYDRVAWELVEGLIEIKNLPSHCHSTKPYQLCVPSASDIAGIACEDLDEYAIERINDDSLEKLQKALDLFAEENSQVYSWEPDLKSPIPLQWDWLETGITSTCGIEAWQRINEPDAQALSS